MNNKIVSSTIIKPVFDFSPSWCFTLNQNIITTLLLYYIIITIIIDAGTILFSFYFVDPHFKSGNNNITKKRIVRL